MERTSNYAESRARTRHERPKWRNSAIGSWIIVLLTLGLLGVIALAYLLFAHMVQPG